MTHYLIEHKSDNDVYTIAINNKINNNINNIDNIDNNCNNNGNTRMMLKLSQLCDLCNSINHSPQSHAPNPKNINECISYVLKNGIIKSFHDILLYFESIEIKTSNSQYIKYCCDQIHRVWSVLNDMIKKNSLFIKISFPNSYNNIPRATLHNGIVSSLPKTCRQHYWENELNQSKSNYNHKGQLCLMQPNKLHNDNCVVNIDNVKIDNVKIDNVNIDDMKIDNVKINDVKINDVNIDDVKFDDVNNDILLLNSKNKKHELDPMPKNMIEVTPQLIGSMSDQTIELLLNSILLDPNNIVNNEYIVTTTTKFILALQKIRNINLQSIPFIANNIVSVCKINFTAGGCDCSDPILAALINSLRYNCCAYLNVYSNVRINNPTSILLSSFADDIMIDIHSLYNYQSDHKIRNVNEICQNIFSIIIEMIDI